MCVCVLVGVRGGGGGGVSVLIELNVEERTGLGSSTPRCCNSACLDPGVFSEETLHPHSDV